MADITPQYLDNLYDNLQKEQLNLLNKLKNRNPTEQDIEREITKQTTVIHVYKSLIFYFDIKIFYFDIKSESL